MRLALTWEEVAPSSLSTLSKGFESDGGIILDTGHLPGFHWPRVRT